MSEIVRLGKFYCESCSMDQDFNRHVSNVAYMTCANCGYHQVSQVPSMSIRLYNQGVLNLQSLERLTEVARALGSPDDSKLIRENDFLHYMEVPADGVYGRLEIDKIRGSV